MFIRIFFSLFLLLTLVGEGIAANATQASTSLVGKWGLTSLDHRNDGTWRSKRGMVTFNSDGTGTDTYYSNDSGVVDSGTQNFTYSIASNQDGSFTLTTYSSKTETHKIVFSDDGTMFIGDGTADNADTTEQKLKVAIKMDTSKTYTNADLSGDYYTMGYEYNSTYTAPPNGNGTHMAISSITNFDGIGNYTYYGTANSDGTIWYDSGCGGSSTYSINSDGSVSIGGCSGGIGDFGYENGKVFIGAVPQSTDQWVSYVSLKKGDTTYSTAGAAGTWAIAGFGDSNGTSFNADFGTITCDSSGNCTYSFKNQTDGSITYPSGSFTISVSSDGSMTTSLTSGAPSYAAAVGNNGNTLNNQ